MRTVERINRKTPNGGAYSEIHYLDDNKRACDKAHATVVRIRECKTDGTLVQETYGRVGRR